MGFDWEKEAEAGSWLHKANDDLRADAIALATEVREAIVIGIKLR